ncbi:hypothetical protein A2W32_02125 [candidate division WWE3 bacterium RBG_16_37_10]|uniref:Septum formation initiator n=1 Tax=candidate division WWE3 bacterium RBG_16_37_10 TaxID=1802610 RepID=A0A1F4V3P9_UNCKA|nr:MAG: hypothetical protein A2W32_02125 [candidate division WWE3 bacterium RBG_16_37_10]
MSIPAQLKYIVLSLLFILAAVNFTRTTLNTLQSSKRLEDLQNEVSVLETEKVGLEQDIAYKKTTDFIEEQARDAINLIKPGEKVYVTSQVLGKSTVSEDAMREPEREKSNPELWVELFF